MMKRKRNSMEEEGGADEWELETPKPEPEPEPKPKAKRGRPRKYPRPVPEDNETKLDATLRNPQIASHEINGSNGAAEVASDEHHGGTTQPAVEASGKSTKQKISRELARLQWESEGVRASKSRVEDDDNHQIDRIIPIDELPGVDEPSLSFTPTKRRGSIPGTPRTGILFGATSTKSVHGRALFATPVKLNGLSKTYGTPVIPRNADRSARRKSTKTLIERTILGNTSDNDEDDEDLLQHIYGSSAEEDTGQEDALGQMPEESNAPATPSRRGRPRTRNLEKKREASPLPQHVFPHELYFSQNRGRTKTSNNNLSTLSLLDHEEYFSLMRQYKDPHTSDIEFLQNTHSGSFNQWLFELSQDFNICIYGWGSKRTLLMNFAEHLYNSHYNQAKHKIVLINGYVPTLTVREVLNTVGAAISSRGQKLGSQPAEMLENLTSILEKDRTQHVTLVINSIDRTPLRRPATQTIISRLSSHPQVSLIASADHPSFPLLWDTSLRSTYNFLFHDCTTFQPYAAEIDVVDEVHELFGRSGRRIGGKEGISFVLKSLPENAKNLFRVLVGEQLVAMSEDYDNDDEEHGRRFDNREPGVEYRVLFNKAAEEFICSNEMNFRTLLKEFHDHQMIQSRKDALGTEILSVPFRKEELETILEDIM